MTLEAHNCAGRTVFIQRAWHAVPADAPPHQKVLGIWKKLEQTPEKVIGVLDDQWSWYGWMTAWACRELGKKCFHFFPVTKDSLRPLTVARSYALGAHPVGIKRSKPEVMLIAARKFLREQSKERRYILPLGMTLREEIVETAALARLVEWPSPSGTVVVSVREGMTAAGLLLGVPAGWDIHFHLSRHRSHDALRHLLFRATKGIALDHVTVTDEGYGPGDGVWLGKSALMLNPTMEAKAWKWLEREGCQTVRNPIVLWDQGGFPVESHR